MVQSINTQLLNLPDFQKDYINFALKVQVHPHPLPSELALDMRGVSTIRDVIYEELGLLTGLNK